jgi:hypothetical protein
LWPLAAVIVRPSTVSAEAEPGQLAALLEVAIAPTPLTSDESIA